jgi:hypothetical protein
MFIFFFSHLPSKQPIRKWSQPAHLLLSRPLELGVGHLIALVRETRLAFQLP